MINDTAPTDMVLREGGVGLFIELLNLVMYHICKQSGRTEGLSSGGGGSQSGLANHNFLSEGAKECKYNVHEVGARS